MCGNSQSGKVLVGGNMNSPTLTNNLIYKEATAATNTIHELLNYVRSRGIDWVPESFGIDSDGKHVLSYIEGVVPHDTPQWIWDDNILMDIAKRLRQWHDATVDFKFHQAQWLLKNDEAHEVICHNDFAPYNCVFQNEKFTGLIDFDTCSPGSRLWDIAYTVYRFIPLLPVDIIGSFHECSPFSEAVMNSRLVRFLEEYSCGDKEFLYDVKTVIKKVEKRLTALAKWSEEYGLQTQNKEILEHAKMYLLHAKWVNDLL
jgi:hypothetical protein